MDEHDIKSRLTRYRPVGPSVELRRFALRPVAPDRIWPWAAAAAVLLAATVGLHVATNRTIARVAMPAGVVSVDMLTSAMGGDEEAERAATVIIQERAFRAFLSGPGLDDQTIEGELKSAN